MTERVYEREQITKTEGKEIRLPNNRRQMGQPGGTEPEVFMEDYAYTFAGGLAKKDYTGCVVGVLVGESVRTESGWKILIEGVVEAKEVVKKDAVCFTEANWTGIYRDIREYFPKLQIVGWFLGGPEFLLEDEERQKKIHMDNFGGGDKIMLKIESMEGETGFYAFYDGAPKRLPGYYIYYEKNIGMQRYMLRERQELRTMPAEEFPSHRLPVAGVSEPLRETAFRTTKSKGVFYRLFYATAGALGCLAVFIIGALAIQLNEREQLKKLLNEQTVSASSTRQVYEVKEGETIEEICRAVYGSESLAREIRLLNGMSEEENPEAGRKIFLP